MSRADDSRVDTATIDDLDAVTELWVALARGQRRHGATLLAGENREVVREWAAQSIVTGELLVARPDRDGRDDPEEDDPEEDDPEEDDPEEDDDHTNPDPPDETGGASDSGLLGFVSFSLEHGGYERDHTRGTVSNLYVRPPRRGEGIGASLLAAAEGSLADAGAETIALEALVKNERAQEFYIEHGYEPRRVELEKSPDREG